MKRGFIYKDEESHKFWWIDYSGCDFAVNYGNYDEIGKFEVEKFDTEEECIKRAEKRIHTKEKKGFVEDSSFDFINRVYIDSKKYDLHPKTSHPGFTEHFTEEFYYEDTDEEAPFGDADGYDTLRFLEEMIMKNPQFNYADFPQYLVEYKWHMKYIPIESFEAEEIKDLDAQRIFDMTQSDIVTYATAFAQIKMTGSISSGLKERGIKAIKRVSLLEGMPWTERKIRRKMIDDLQSFEHVID